MAGKGDDNDGGPKYDLAPILTFLGSLQSGPSYENKDAPGAGDSGSEDLDSARSWEVQQVGPDGEPVEPYFLKPTGDCVDGPEVRPLAGHAHPGRFFGGSFHRLGPEELYAGRLATGERPVVDQNSPAPSEDYVAALEALGAKKPGPHIIIYFEGNQGPAMWDYSGTQEPTLREEWTERLDLDVSGLVRGNWDVPKVNLGFPMSPALRATLARISQETALAAEDQSAEEGDLGQVAGLLYPNDDGQTNE